MAKRPAWSTPLPRPIKILQVMTLKTLPDVRKLLGHIPKERRRPIKVASVASMITMGVSCLLAQTVDDPRNTIDCAAFTKHPNGTWYVGEPTTVAFGTASMRLGHIEIGPGAMYLAGVDLYTVIEHKCGGTRS